MLRGPVDLLVIIYTLMKFEINVMLKKDKNLQQLPRNLAELMHEKQTFMISILNTLYYIAETKNNIAL